MCVERDECVAAMLDWFLFLLGDGQQRRETPTGRDSLFVCFSWEGGGDNSAHESHPEIPNAYRRHKSAPQ